jgi:hypothetical protein
MAEMYTAKVNVAWPGDKFIETEFSRRADAQKHVRLWLDQLYPGKWEFKGGELSGSYVHSNSDIGIHRYSLAIIVTPEKQRLQRSISIFKETIEHSKGELLLALKSLYEIYQSEGSSWIASRLFDEYESISAMSYWRDLTMQLIEECTELADAKDLTGLRYGARMTKWRMEQAASNPDWVELHKLRGVVQSMRGQLKKANANVKAMESVIEKLSKHAHVGEWVNAGFFSGPRSYWKYIAPSGDEYGVYDDADYNFYTEVNGVLFGTVHLNDERAREFVLTHIAQQSGVSQ